jgi:hypothetical protein
MTPEGKVKRAIKRVLDEHGSKVYYYMPVPGGFGKQSVDYLGCAGRTFFAIEAKGKPGMGATPRQQGVLAEIRDAGGLTFVINDDVTLGVFKVWLEGAVIR